MNEADRITIEGKKQSKKKLEIKNKTVFGAETLKPLSYPKNKKTAGKIEYCELETCYC